MEQTIVERPQSFTIPTWQSLVTPFRSVVKDLTGEDPRINAEHAARVFGGAALDMHFHGERPDVTRNRARLIFAAIFGGIVVQVLDEEVESQKLRIGLEGVRIPEIYRDIVMKIRSRTDIIVPDAFNDPGNMPALLFEAARELTQAMSAEQEIFENGTTDEYLALTATTTGFEMIVTAVTIVLNQEEQITQENVHASIQNAATIFRILADMQKVGLDVIKSKPNVVLKIMAEKKCSQAEAAVIARQIAKEIDQRQHLLLSRGNSSIQQYIQLCLNHGIESMTSTKAQIIAGLLNILALGFRAIHR
jgi:hypothetical protein